MTKTSAVKYSCIPLQTASLLLTALLVVLFPLTAQAAGPATPDAGSILQQIQQSTPPTQSSAETKLKIEQKDERKLPPSAPFLVKTIRISGNTLFDTATLHALVADEAGKTMTLAQLGGLAARIADYYHSHGYPLAQALIPAQTIRNGMVVIKVIEARYGKITLDNHSPVSDPLLRDALTPLQSGQVIGQTELDHTLLLLSDIPGVVVNATLKPGENAGTSELLVDTTAGRAFSGNVTLDDYGNRYTGRARAGGTANLINPLHHGDVLSVSGLTSGSGLNYGRIGYDFLLNGEGTRIGASYSMLHYTLGEPLEALEAHGTAQVMSLWGKHPLIRSQDVNLYGQIQYDRLQLDDHVDAAAIETDRHLDNGTLSLAGDARDMFLPGSTDTWNLGWTIGQVGFDNGAAQLADAATAGTEGGFMKWTANFSHLQRLTPEDGLYFAFSGQWANGNLDSSAKMIAGGTYSVRAYDIGAISGDTVYQGTAEFRHDLGLVWDGQWQAAAFIDSAYVVVNKNAWAAGTNSAMLTGAGVGLNWTGPDQWSARATIATPIGVAPELVASTASVRAWVEISKGF